MRSQAFSLGLASASLALLSGLSIADTIYLLDGKSLTEVKVTEETFKDVAYKDGSKKKTIKTDSVLRIEFSAKSPLVDRADTAAADGQLLEAIDDLTVYVEGFISSGRQPRYKWEPAYAMFRLVELNAIVGDLENLLKSADLLIEKVPESRFVPKAFLAKAEAQFLSGDSAGAQKTLKDFLNLIQGKTLSRRWQIEQKLASVLFDTSLTGKALRDKLDAISDQAGSEFPLVGNRADVAIGESLVSSKKFKEAKEIFEGVIESSQAEPRTLAAAYTGLGDCLFKQAVESRDGGQKQELLMSAATAYMRVVVVYRDQALYAPKAMFWAGRVFDESSGEDDKDKAQKLYTRLMREYRGTSWADEANAFRKR
jgi:tetratricopeptide (TPR) repeat protein